MALFNAKEKKGEEKATETTAAAPVVVPATVTAVLRAPHITEKATDLAAQNVYVFTIDPSANKRQVKDAVKALYKVEPVNVRIVTLPRKSIRHPRRGVYGTGTITKKAYVQLKKGDSISLM